MNTKNLLIALAAGLVLTAPSIRADDPPVPTANFPASRYEALWTKSPFAVATAETATDTSPDYMLVGIANVDGISYASVIETKQPQEHFLISSDKPNRGLTLTSITHSHDGQDTFAAVQKDGQSITLKLEQPPAMVGAPGVPGMPPVNQMPAPNIMIPQITMPGTNPGGAFPYPGSARPFPRIHRPAIHLPPPPTGVQVPPPSQPPQ
jgi:hypothetical protein